MSPALGIIADDFTGALLVAGELEAAGIPCDVLFTPAAALPEGDAPVAILATRTRLAPKAEVLAVLAEAAAALAGAGCPRLAYKACATFDSTESGNIGPAADFLADRARGPALMSAGFPHYNVTVFQGYLFYRGRLVSESIKRFDPLTPMTDPDLVRFLSHQTQQSVALLPHARLREGIAAARKAFDELRLQGNHVLADTADDDDVAVTAQLAVESAAPVVASDPVIIAYARLVAAESVAPRPAPPQHVAGPAAILAGSVGPIALTHLAHFGQQHPVLKLDLLDPRPAAEIAEAAIDWAAAHLGTTPFAITTADDQDGVARVQATHGPVGAARRAETLLGAIAKGLHDRGVRRFVVAGGETSGAIVAALGLTRARALPAGSLGSGFCVAEGPGGRVSLFLKSGKLGAEDIFVRAIEAMA